MAAFEYKALDAKGKQKKGTIEGDNACLLYTSPSPRDY